MKRFENAQVGDLVWSDTFGEGVVLSIKDGGVAVNFNNIVIRTYDLDGCYINGSDIPSLFYRDATSNYLTERPSPKLDWSKVPVDTKVCVSHNPELSDRRYFCSIDLAGVACFVNGATSWSGDNKCIWIWPYAELAEPVTIDGVTWPVGTKWEGS